MKHLNLSEEERDAIGISAAMKFDERRKLATIERYSPIQLCDTCGGVGNKDACGCCAFGHSRLCECLLCVWITTARRHGTTIARYERSLRALAEQPAARVLDKVEAYDWARAQAKAVLDGG